MRTLSCVLLITGLAGAALPLRAQDPGQVESLAAILMAQDRKEFNPALLAKSLSDPDPLVRRTAAMSIGRLRDARGTRLLIPLLSDTAKGVATSAVFAMGLLHDTSAVAPLIARLGTPDPLETDAVSEAATALATIGGATAARYVGEVLTSGGDLSRDRRPLFLPNALLDAWRLGSLAPVAAIQRFMRDTSADTRWRALYTLGRLRVAPAATAIFQALQDKDDGVRATAAGALTRRFVDSTSLGANTVKSALSHAFDDLRPGVRISALEAASSWRDSMFAKNASPLLDDEDLNVQVAAAIALGTFRGSIAVRELSAVFDRKNATWALKRNALDALAHADTATFAKRAAPWLASTDPRERAAALEGWGVAAPADPAVFVQGMLDRDLYVQSVALTAWHVAHPRGDTALAVATRARLKHADPVIREGVADAMRAGVVAEDLDALLAGWRLSLADPDYPARLSILRTLRALARRDTSTMARLAAPDRRDFLTRPADPLMIAEAARTLAGAFARTGPARTDRYPSLARGLSEGRADLCARHGQPACHDRGAGQGEHRCRAVPAGGAAHGRELPAARRPALLRRHPVVQGRPQLRDPDGGPDQHRRWDGPRHTDPRRDQPGAVLLL